MPARQEHQHLVLAQRHIQPLRGFRRIKREHGDGRGGRTGEVGPRVRGLRADRPQVHQHRRTLAASEGRGRSQVLAGVVERHLRAIVEAGGSVIAQDEATSVVWGMPGAVTNHGLAAAVLPLPRIAPTIASALMTPLKKVSSPAIGVNCRLRAASRGGRGWSPSLAQPAASRNVWPRASSCRSNSWAPTRVPK